MESYKNTHVLCFCVCISFLFDVIRYLFVFVFICLPFSTPYTKKSSTAKSNRRDRRTQTILRRIRHSSEAARNTVIAPWHVCKPLPSIVCKELGNATHVPPDAMAKPMATPKLAKPKLAKPEVGEARSWRSQSRRSLTIANDLLCQKGFAPIRTSSRTKGDQVGHQRCAWKVIIFKCGNKPETLKPHPHMPIIRFTRRCLLSGAWQLSNKLQNHHS